MAVCVYPEDAREDAAHFGLFEEAALMAVASVYREPLPGESDAAMWRLRGMATAPEARRRGHGAALIAACIAHIEANGGGALWCNARTTASAFYERVGFSRSGAAFELPNIGPHYRMLRSIPRIR